MSATSKWCSVSVPRSKSIAKSKKSKSSRLSVMQRRSQKNVLRCKRAWCKIWQGQAFLATRWAKRTRWDSWLTRTTTTSCRESRKPWREIRSWACLAQVHQLWDARIQLRSSLMLWGRVLAPTVLLLKTTTWGRTRIWTRWGSCSKRWECPRSWETSTGMIFLGKKFAHLLAKCTRMTSFTLCWIRSSSRWQERRHRTSAS